MPLKETSCYSTWNSHPVHREIKGVPKQVLIRSNASAKLAWLAILLLAACHSVLYASYLPPWGLIDEEQHVHYIQMLAEQHAIPIVGETFLSPEIINSLFETRRWEVFHWRTPLSRDPRDMGVEGYSYEGFQPPLFYLLAAPVYAILPNDILVKVFGLRYATVGLSLLTIWITFRIAADLFPQRRLLPYLICTLLIMIPERALAAGRVNNDALIEVMAAAFVWACTRALLQGISIRQSQLMGMLLGLGLLTKTSMALLAVLLPFVFWFNRRDPNCKWCVLWTGGIPAAFLATWFTCNASLYGNLSNWNNFTQLMILPAPPVTWSSVTAAVWDLFRHFWMVWWKGSAAGSNPIANVLLLVLMVLSVLSFIGLMQQMTSPNNSNNKKRVILAFLATIGIYGVITLAVYFDQDMPLVRPVIHLRFLLPVLVPVIILFSWGLANSPARITGLVIAIGVLMALDALSLFGNLLPYFYYWSAFVVNGVPQPHMPLDLQATWALFYPRFLADKPPFLRPLLVWILPVYMGLLVFCATTLRKLATGASSDAQIDG